MAAPTSNAEHQITLATGEPSTHGYFQNSWRPEITSAVTSTADLLPRTSEVGWEAEVSGGRENVSS